MKLRGHLLAGSAVAMVVLAVPQAALAEETGSVAGEAAQQQPQSSNDIVVQADIGYRNRSDSPEPVLVYDEEYFQRFEPLTAGDALKRVPSVTFLSDVIESDGPRLRGLDPGYTQLLINGERVPGPNPDRSFFLDRIPAELIEQVEIVRSSSARRTGDAIAGTINIKLRDAFTLDGGYVKGGGLLFDDGELKPTAGLYYGGDLGPGRVLVGANVQGRYNPKIKQSLRYGDSPENDPNYATDAFDNREDQTDTRDGWDYALNGSWGIDGAMTDFEVAGSWVRTDRTESERSFEYNVETGDHGPVADEDDDNPGLLTDNDNVAEIEQTNWSVTSKLSHEWSLGETTLRAGYARFDDHRDEIETEVAFDTDEGDDPEWESTLALTRTKDEEVSLSLDHEFPLSMDVGLVIGGFWQNKNRDTDVSEGEQDGELDDRSWDQFTDTPAGLPGTFDGFETVPGGLAEIGETRSDLFALVEGNHGALNWEAGVRWENTHVEIADIPAATRDENDYDVFLPSASLKYAIGDGRVTVSAARTLRRPQFDYLSPALLEEELGDNDFLGNPQLEPEMAWGGDLGYEHRLGRSGVIGVNVFYRKVEDLIELATAVDANGDPIPGSAQDEDEDDVVAFIFQPQNVGDGEVYGIEFDLSTDLGFIGLPDTGIFGNVSWLDSEVDDVFGTRRFNSQSEYVYNFGFIHNLRQLGAAFGATYRKQGSAFGRVISEEVTTTYGADLEVFVEKRFGDSFTIRAVGSNLLNGKKRESFNKFDTVEDQMDRDFDEYELEAEEAGPVFQLVARYAF
ncbi:MAG TPA: TonB-dependent receptor [Croceibacterium sp.]